MVVVLEDPKIEVGRTQRPGVRLGGVALSQKLVFVGRPMGHADLVRLGKTEVHTTDPHPGRPALPGDVEYRAHNETIRKHRRRLVDLPETELG